MGPSLTARACPGFRSDVGIVDGKIASIGRIRDGAQETIDAEGHVVTPGFIDGHTHMDAQVSWDPLGTCFLLARHYQRGDGQLRIFARAV